MSAGRCARVVCDAGAELGEGPAWHAARGELLWVDISAGVLHRWAGERREPTRLQLAAPLPAVLPAASGAELLLLRDRVVRSWGDGDGGGSAPELVAQLELEADVRFNDATCDPAGRLWAGTMAADREGAGSLYRIDADGAVSVHRSALTISNGIGFSPDATRLYHVDTPTRRIDALPFDVDRGTLGRARAFVQLGVDDGLPDGLCVDVEGGVWVALWQAAEVRRYRADGALDAVVATPARCPSSCAFGGPSLDELFVTSSAWGGRQLAGADPCGGALMSLRPGVRGLPVAPFAGA